MKRILLLLMLTSTCYLAQATQIRTAYDARQMLMNAHRQLVGGTPWKQKGNRQEAMRLFRLVAAQTLNPQAQNEAQLMITSLESHARPASPATKRRRSV